MNPVDLLLLDGSNTLPPDKFLQPDAVISLKHYRVAIDNDVERQHPSKSIEPSP